jgi:hypothetical protein
MVQVRSPSDDEMCDQFEIDGGELFGLLGNLEMNRIGDIILV